MATGIDFGAPVPITVGINKLELRAGDVVVVHLRTPDAMLPNHWAATQEEIDLLRAQLHAVLPAGVKAMVMTGADLTVLRNGTAVEPLPADVDAPTLVAVPAAAGEGGL